MSETGFLRLKAIQEKNNNHQWVNQDIYRLMYREELYIVAYERIKSKPGNMTRGSDKQTLDGFSMEIIHTIIEQMRAETFQFKPARRVCIPKLSGNGSRPLSIPCPRDKIVQEVIRIILEAIYDSPEDSYFCSTSYGFRQGKNQHGALKEIREKWTGITWFVEGDIEKCFDEISHSILIELLAKKIQDDRFLRLIRKALKSGYLQSQKYIKTWVGAGQGSIISPILSNIYMHELDKFMEELCNKYTKGKSRKPNPTYRRIKYLIERQTKKLGKNFSDKEVRELDKQRKSMPSGDPYDTNYVRVRYVRFADDFLVGITGPKKLAEEIRREIKIFILSKLNLRLNLDKTKITHAKSGKASFLGFDITTSKPSTNGYKCKRGSTTFVKRFRAGEVKLLAPMCNIIARLRKQGFGEGDYHNFKPTHRSDWINHEPETIIRAYSATWRGVTEYWGCAWNFHALSRIKYILKHSLAKTLAAKYKTKQHTIFRRFGNPPEITFNREGKTYNVKFEQNNRLKRNLDRFQTAKKLDLLDVYINQRSRSKLGYSCSICNSSESIEMHHVRHIRKLGKATTGFTRTMAMLNRKQIPVCKSCHRKIHDGKYDGISLKDLVSQNS